MNIVKYQRRDSKTGFMETKTVRVTQRKREIEREVRCKPSLIHPDGRKSIPPRFPTVSQANRKMLKLGWSRA